MSLMTQMERGRGSPTIASRDHLRHLRHLRTMDQKPLWTRYIRGP